MLSTLKYTISALLLASSGVAAQTTADTTARQGPLHQLRFGIDVGRFVANAIDPTRIGYELTADYYYKKEIYFVGEGGFGHSSVDYPDLKYTSSNYYLRFGMDKALLPRLLKNDWDAIFFGLRYGFAGVQRNAATYTVTDSLFGSTSGSIDPHHFTAHWAEVALGIRLNLYKGLMTGWNIRGKFMLNGTTFRELPPAYIGGYGKGDRSTAFDFNVYLLYALRW